MLERLGTKFVGGTFEDLSVDKGNQEAFDRALKIADGDKRGLVLLGKIGRGKTALLAALANAFDRAEEGSFEERDGRDVWVCRAKRRQAEVWSILDLVAALRDQARSERTKNTVCESCMYADLLLIDDLGAERSTDFVLEELQRIFDYRYRHELPIVITSNLTLDEIGSKYGARPISRWVESCAIIRMKGPDRRLKEGKGRNQNGAE